MRRSPTLDPHSNYLDPRGHSDQRNALSGGFGGLGIEVELADGLVRVVTPMENSPAARAGLQSGDLIVRFDNQPVLGMTLADAISRMRGQPGTAISLIIRRPGRDDEFSVSLVRETIRTQALRWRMEEDVLVLRVASFTSSLGATIEKAISEATATRPPRAVILDMRGNPGGLLNQAVVVADIFLSEGEIVSLRGRTAGNRRSLEGRCSGATRRPADGGADQWRLGLGRGTRCRGAAGKWPRDGHGPAQLRQGQRAVDNFAGRGQRRASSYHRALSRTIGTDGATYRRRPRYRAGGDASPTRRARRAPRSRPCACVAWCRRTRAAEGARGAVALRACEFGRG